MLKVTENWPSASVDKLKLTTRSRNLLRNAGVYTVGQLSAMSQFELLSIPGMGAVSARNCRSAVRELMTERAVMRDAANALVQAVDQVGIPFVVPTKVEALEVIEALKKNGWELRRS
jgi:DNA-directed RNA polymerase alpha subunit